MKLYFLKMHFLREQSRKCIFSERVILKMCFLGVSSVAFFLFFILLRHKFLIYTFTNCTMPLTVLWPNWLILEKCDELKNWLFEQPVDNQSCSSIQFLLRQFYQKYKKVLCRVLGLEISIPWNIRFFFSGGFFWAWA